MTGFFGPLPISLLLSFRMLVVMKSSPKTEQSASFIDMFIDIIFGEHWLLKIGPIFFVHFVALHEWSEMRRLASRVT